MMLIIDANNLAWRANVTSDLTTSSGIRTSAIYGSLQMIASYLKASGGAYKNKMREAINKVTNEDKSFSDVIMCWDAGRSKARKEIYPEYKAHRDKNRAEKTTEEQQAYYQFIEQMEELHAVLPDFGVRSLKIKGWEGDDLIYAVTQLTDKHCIVVSTDKDMLQLVSDQIWIWSPFKEQLITPENFEEITGVRQKSYLAFRILQGDKSDNIGGVPGIGAVTAKDLVSKYATLEGIKQNKTPLMKVNRTKKIFDNLEILDRNDKLMNLKNVPMEEIDHEVNYVLNKAMSFDEKYVKSFLMTKQFVSILSDFLTWSKAFKELN